MTTRSVTAVEDMRNSLSKMQEQFSTALPKHIGAEKFIRVVMTAVSLTPDLLLADRTSFFGACMKAAQDGLLPDGKEAALLVYNTKQKDGSWKKMVQYIPMVAGILKKVRNSGELSMVTSQVVFDKDRFRYWVDHDGEHLEHEPIMFGDRGDRIGTYALAKTKDGAVYIEIMTEDQINDVKNVSKAKESGPWAGAFADEMRRKTAIRRLSKRLPMSTDLEQVIRRDDDLYDFNDLPKPVKEATTKPSRLSKIVAKTVAEMPKIEEPELKTEEPEVEEFESDEMEQSTF